jgi:hypothetical protein
MSPPSPLLAPWAADEVAATTEAGSRAESFVIANGSDLRWAPPDRDEHEVVAVDSIPLVRASHGPDDFK